MNRLKKLLQPRSQRLPGIATGCKTGCPWTEFTPPQEPDSSLPDSASISMVYVEGLWLDGEPSPNHVEYVADMYENGNTISPMNWNWAKAVWIQNGAPASEGERNRWFCSVWAAVLTFLYIKAGGSLYLLVASCFYCIKKTTGSAGGSKKL